MSGSSKATRQAQDAANQAESARQELEKQTREYKQRADREQRKAQRLLMRQLRAAGGGYFETDTSSSLGGTGELG